MTDEDITQKQILSDSIRRRYAYLKRRRKVRAMRIFWGRVRMLIRLACIYFLCVGIWKFMHLPQWYLPPKAFDTYNSSRVEFEGNKIATNQQILNMMKRAAQRLNILIRYNLLYNIAMLVKSGFGDALCIRLDCVYPGLRFIPLSPPLRLGSVLVWKKQQITSPAVGALIAHTKQYLESISDHIQ